MQYTSITVYGIPNCDTVKKARTWLSEQGFEPVFHDFKKQGLPEKILDNWLEKLGWESVLNRKGTSWRKLSPEEQLSVTSAASTKPFCWPTQAWSSDPSLSGNQKKKLKSLWAFNQISGRCVKSIQARKTHRSKLLYAGFMNLMALKL
jgi:arsenate reductase (glutaredoxin)